MALPAPTFRNPARVQLVQPDHTILSSYPLNSARSALVPLADTREGWLTPDAAEALLQLHRAVGKRGGDFRVTSAYRSIEVQQQARAKFLAWVNAGSPAPGSQRFDAKTMKPVFVASPGNSFHNAGRSIDIDVASLRFPGVAKDKQLDVFWELAKPFGWRPVISAPSEGAAESWHFDFMGPWLPVYERLLTLKLRASDGKAYSMTAHAACTDIGEYGPLARPVERAVQAQLHRAGFNPGVIDGFMGAKTLAAVDEAAPHAPGLTSTVAPMAMLDALMRLPDSLTQPPPRLQD